MKEVVFRSFVVQEGLLVPINRLSGPVTDQFYIEGAIELAINGQEFLGRDTIDLVDQLWVYLLNLVEDLMRDKIGELSFPDQPIQIIAGLNSNESKVFLRLGKPFDREANVPWGSFVCALARGAFEFFEILARVDDRTSGRAMRVFSQIARITRAFDGDSPFNK